MLKNKLRVISLVPSWTETLISADVLVVGRTRFCIYPQNSVKNIPSVGGTKNLDLPRIRALKPDVVVLDRQENTKEMADLLSGAEIPFIDTDVTGFQSLMESCELLGDFFGNDFLHNISRRYQTVLSKLDSSKLISTLILKGSMGLKNLNQPVEYVIWKNPFMVVGKNTFIAENVKLLGFDLVQEKKYPEITSHELKKAFCFFSGEPFPFANHFDELIKEGFSGVLIDGEKLSWFGIRNLNFLESCVQ